MLDRLAVLLIGLFLLGSCSERPAPSNLTIATTTSLQGSGLLPLLAQEFRVDSGIQIQAFVVGSGQALQLARRGEAELTITHDPAAEQLFIGSGRAVRHRELMWNEFVIVGPDADPAAIRESASVEDAFRRIVSTRSRFCSRNDRSATHARELLIWRNLGVDPRSNPNYLPMGQPMAHLLRSASELQSYTLTDAATYAQLRPGLQLQQLFSGDAALRNVYRVMVVRNREKVETKNADRFFEWLTRGRGRQVVERYTIRGQRQFFMTTTAPDS